MNCLKFSELITYQNQELGHSQSVERHLETCSDCRKKLQDIEKLAALLKMNSSFKPAQHSSECYNDFQLLDVIEAKSNNKIRKEYYSHVSQCDFCLDRLVALEDMLHELKCEGLIPSQKILWERIIEVVATGHSKIKKRLNGVWKVLGSPSPVYRWAGVAVVIFAVSFGLWQTLKNDRIPFTTRESRLENQIILLSPENRSVITKPTRLEFEWSGIEKTTLYNFVLLDENGSIIWEKKTDHTKLILPNDIQLQPSMIYFWQVEAVMDFGIAIQSEMANFVFAPN